MRASLHCAHASVTCLSFPIYPLPPLHHKANLECFRGTLSLFHENEFVVEDRPNWQNCLSVTFTTKLYFWSLILCVHFNWFLCQNILLWWRSLKLIKFQAKHISLVLVVPVALFGQQFISLMKIRALVVMAIATTCKTVCVHADDEPAYVIFTSNVTITASGRLCVCWPPLQLVRCRQSGWNWLPRMCVRARFVQTLFMASEFSPLLAHHYRDLCIFNLIWCSLVASPCFLRSERR